jgi:hypothetical protein
MSDQADDCGNMADAPPADVGQVTTQEETVLAEVVILLRDHPRWAVWIPVGGGNWTAIRPASSSRPAPELPTIWVHADTAVELARLMESCDEQVAGRAAVSPPTPT